MRLCNFSNTSYHLDWYDGQWTGLKEFLNEHGLNGIELLLHGNTAIENVPKAIVKGLHLSYFPTWLDFYKGKYTSDYPDDASFIETFGGTTKDALHDRFRSDFEVAKSLEVEYMVYHVSHVTIQDAYTFEFDYTNEEVLSHTLEIVNDVFTEDGPTLLFENLWWPGLTLLNRDEIEWFMSKVKYQNKGIMLDLSHLMLTGHHLKNEEEAIDYILDTLNKLGDSIRWIQGIHINGTDFFDYIKKDHRQKYEAYLKAEEKDKFMMVYQHISAMDRHIPLKNRRLKEIIELVKPKYEMIELVGRDKAAWEGYVAEQLKVLDVL